MRDDMKIRAMAPGEIAVALDWAAEEGWNPGLRDGDCFATVDPYGFLIGELDGRPAAVISCVNYDDRFAFLGFYIVRPDLRGQGHGLRIWNAAIAHAGSRVIGLDGVVAQQDNYRRSGFVHSHANVRYGGEPIRRTASAAAEMVPLAEVPFGLIEASDAEVFPAPRAGFLRRWTSAPDHQGRAMMRDGAVAAWGVIRPCRSGHKIGPLVATDPEAAHSTLHALLAAVPGEGPIFLDVPAPNEAAVTLAKSMGLSPVFETARMYTGLIGPLRTERVFGVTTFELG